MTNILILDIGNSKTKCYIFDIDVTRKYYQTCDCIYEKSVATPRKHPWDLLDTCRDLLIKAIDTCAPDAGMVTAFGDAFILKSKKRSAFADEPAPQLLEYAYHIDGWPRDIQLSGIRALKTKHQSQWEDMYSPNGWVTSQLCGKPNDDPWHAWDITQASVSGCFNLQSQKWIDIDTTTPKDMVQQKYQYSHHKHPYYKNAPNIIPSSKKVGTFQGMPLLAGGMDNAFVDTSNPDPYIVAGTWLVIGCLAKTDKKGKPCKKEWTQKRRDAGVRWLISGNGNYHKQIVRKVSNPITEDEMQQALKDLEVLGVEPTLTGNRPESKKWFTPARVRVFGGYAQMLADDLTDQTRNFHFLHPDRHRTVRNFTSTNNLLNSSSMRYKNGTTQKHPDLWML